MDPASIVGLVASCTSLIATVGRSSIAVHSFVRSCRDARKELGDTARQLVLIRDDFEPFGSGDCQQLQIPDSLATEVPSIITNSSMVVAELDSLITQYSNSSSSTGVKWTLSGREKTSALNRQLDAHIRCLNLALDFLKLSITKSIHRDTQQLVQDSAVIKDNIELLPGIRDQIDELRDQIENLPVLLENSSDPRQKSGFALQRWLETATTYYEGSVADVGSIFHDDLTVRSDSEDETARVTAHTVAYEPVEPLDDYGGEREGQPSNLDRISPLQNGFHGMSTVAQGHTVHGHRTPRESGGINSSDDRDAQFTQQPTMEYEAGAEFRSLQREPELLNATSVTEVPSSSRIRIQEGSILRTRYTPGKSTKFFRAGHTCLSPGGQFIFCRIFEEIITVIETTAGRLIGKVSVEPREFPGPSFIARIAGERPGTVLPIPNSGAILVHDGMSMPKIYDWRSNSKFQWELPEAYKRTRWTFLGNFGISSNGQFLSVYSSTGWNSLFREMFSSCVANPRLSIWEINYDTRSISLFRDYRIKEIPHIEITSTTLTLSPVPPHFLDTVVLTVHRHPDWTTNIWVQPIDQSEWSPRTLSLPKQGYKASTHPNSPTTRNPFQGEQIFLQRFRLDFRPVHKISGAGAPWLTRYTLDGKQREKLYFDWIVDTEYGDNAPDDKRSFLQVLWISSRESVVVTLCRLSQNSSRTDENLYISVWHAGNKVRIFGPEKIVPKQVFTWVSSHCSADVKGEVLFVSVADEFWFWRFDQVLEQ